MRKAPPITFPETDFWVKNGGVRGLGVTKKIENKRETAENTRKRMKIW
jgi:hypothetical protein